MVKFKEKRRSATRFNKNLYSFRGVAQLVARQFRVLEAWSSNLHTSTKKKKRALVVLFFFLAGVFDSTPFALCAKEFAFQTKPSESLFSSGKCRNIAHRAKPPRSDSPCGCLFFFDRCVRFDFTRALREWSSHTPRRARRARS